MTKFRLREVVRRNGTQYTVEQIAEDPKSEPRYWLQQGRDFSTRVWAREYEIEDSGVRETAAAQFQREQAAQRLRFGTLTKASVGPPVIRPEDM